MSTPDKNRLEFADELRRLRVTAGLSGKQDATDSDVATWLEAVDAPEPVAAEGDDARRILVECSRFVARKHNLD